MFESYSPLKRYYKLWPFKKRAEVDEIPSVTATTVICIPGIWTDIEDLKNSIFSASNGEYMAVGDILLSVSRERHYKLEIGEKDERMKGSFRQAGLATRITEDCLAEIEKHNYVIYISGETGSLAEAENIAFAGAAVLKAGGIGIKIETAGKAFEKAKWLNLVKNFEEPDLYQMFVAETIIDKDNSACSCGMHNLGLKDTIISGEEFQKSADLLSLFAYYQIFDKPELSGNQTFRPNLQSPAYSISDEPRQPYRDTELLGNPFGMWRLTGM